MRQIGSCRLTDRTFFPPNPTVLFSKPPGSARLGFVIPPTHYEELLHCMTPASSCLHACKRGDPAWIKQQAHQKKMSTFCRTPFFFSSFLLLQNNHPLNNNSDKKEQNKQNMGHSYNKLPKATNTEAPPQWVNLRPHKYCGQIDRAGRVGKPNKAQKCDACMAVKAASDKAIQRDTAARRQEKMGWDFGE